MAPNDCANTAARQSQDLVIVSGVKHEPLFKHKRLLERLYIEEQLSTKQISQRLGAARSTISKQLKLFEIPMRSETLARRMRKGQLRFGEKRIQNELQAHVREQQALGKMIQLRSQGFSYWKIADILNTMKIPTKNRKARWHPTTVMQILKASSMKART